MDGEEGGNEGSLKWGSGDLGSLRISPKHFKME